MLCAIGFSLNMQTNFSIEIGLLRVKVHKNQGIMWLFAGEVLGQLEQAGGARGIVIGSVVNSI
jgi:hypothetical protein